MQGEQDDTLSELVNQLYFIKVLKIIPLSDRVQYYQYEYSLFGIF